MLKRITTYGPHEFFEVYDPKNQHCGNALGCYTPNYPNSVSLNCDVYEKHKENIKWVIFSIDYITKEPLSYIRRVKNLSVEQINKIVERKKQQFRNGTSYWIFDWPDIENCDLDLQDPTSHF